MSYRKIEVDGQVFEYSIGKTHTKIRHVGAFANGDVGVRVQKYWSGELFNDVQVRPSDISAFIRQNNLKVKSEDKRRKA